MSQIEAQVTVGEVWQLALPAGTALAGGSAGLCQPVEWVSSLRASFPLFGALERGYLALARLDLARRLDPRVTPSYLLQELHKAQAAGLIADEHISSADAALADELGLPVFVLPEGADLHQLERDILRALVDREGQLARREAEARRHLQQLFGRGGIQGVVDELARLTGGDVWVVDETLARLAHAVQLSANQQASEATFPIRVAGRSLGQMGLRTLAARCSPLDSIYARQAAEICGIEILQRLTRQETEERLGIDLVEQLLDADGDQEATIARFERLGYNLTPERKHVVLVLGTQAQENQYVACHDVARDIQWAAERDGARVLIASYRKHFVVFASLPPTTSERAPRRWSQTTQDSQAEPRCSIGVSRMLVGIAGLRSAVSQALDAWELGHHISDLSSPYYYEELGLYRLLAGLRARDELRRFYDETLGPLVRYDQIHGTDLTHTLEVFFEQNANASQTSRALYVHRNTLNYRLQRIAEICGLDLDQAEARLAFQLALKFHRLLH